MNKEVKKKWVSALRSGKYKQCKEKLNDGHGGYCCLGVLSAIGVKEGVCTRKNAFFNGAELIEDIYNWAGLSNRKSPENPVINKKCLSQYNDGEGAIQKNFKQIADLIEKYL